MQIIFQDPYSSLNPRMTVREIVGEAIAIHKLAKTRADEEARIAQLLERWACAPDAMDRYPHEFSGGQRQRIGIARALAVRARVHRVRRADQRARRVDPGADREPAASSCRRRWASPTSSSRTTWRSSSTSSHRVAVMYLGKIVEQATADAALRASRGTPTRARCSRRRRGRTRSDKRVRLVLEGDVPSPIDPPPGCAFHPRCPRAIPGKCDATCRRLEEIGDGSGHKVACWNPHTE